MLEKLNKIEDEIYLKPLIIDIEGKPRGLILRGIKHSYEGICFDGSSIKGHTTIEKSDLIAKPDPKTIRTIKMSGRKMKIAICDIENVSKEPYRKNTRMKLKEYVYDLEKYKWKIKIGVEIEYFIIKRSEKLETYDKDQYFEIAPYTKSEKIQLKIMEKLSRIGIELEKTHHEVAEGQYEYSIKASDPITTADNIVIAKMVTKDVVRKYGFEATFMPKPFKNMNGSGMHIHMSILNENGENIFYDKSNDNISQEALYAIGGILKNSKEISILVAPTVNSYKRLKPEYEAPNKICWGYGNRSALIRVPTLINRETCRIEYRHPDPSCNPYLAIIAVIASAKKGIINRVNPGEPCMENAYKAGGKYDELPSSLGEALNMFENSRNAVEIVGEELHSEIVKIKREEWREYLEYLSSNKLNDNDITDWEINRYLVKA